MSHKEADLRRQVADRYSAIVRDFEEKGEHKSGTGCCATDTKRVKDLSKAMGYQEQDLKAVPEGANMGLGCGNPTAIASIKAGETVLDLGSGGGFDCFLAAEQVGKTGSVIGVDMSQDMLEKARKNAEKINANNVEFRLGEIEHLPVADNSVDLIFSNCVINLSPNKPQVFAESKRVLKSGGRLAISDVIALKSLPEAIRRDLDLHCACISGAALLDDVTQILENLGFKDIVITPKPESKEFMQSWAPNTNITDYLISANIIAYAS